MATKLAVEFSRCAALVIGAGRLAPGIETEVRSALEAGSVAWWLLEPQLTARQRVCRMQLLRRNSAREYARSIDEVGEDPAVAGNETVAGIEAECLALGLGSFTAGGDKAQAYIGEPPCPVRDCGESRPRSSALCPGPCPGERTPWQLSRW